MSPVDAADDVDLDAISPMAWRLLRTAAGYEQREVERNVDDIMQAHVSMLENETRSLSRTRLAKLYELYAAELTEAQIDAIVDTF